LLTIKKTILVVDDDKDMQSYISKILTNLGYEVLCTNNTEDAFALVLDNVPHLILLDVNLEGEYGFSLLEKMNQVDLLDKINVFMISSSTNKQSIVLSKQFGVEGFLLKPINNNILMNTAKKYVKEYKFPPMVFPEEENHHVVLKIPGEITKLNEVSFSIRSKIKFKEPRRVEIESSFLQSLGVNRGHYKVYQQSRDINPGIYDTIIVFIGLNDNTLQNIRKVQTKKV
jgi:DNA-binding response OmpR family regulator